MKFIHPGDIQIRNFTIDDIEPLASYWTEGSRGFWLSRGVDPQKIKTKAEFIANYTKFFQEAGDLREFCVIEFQGQAIGNHSLTELMENEQGLFHAHIWTEAFRRRGIGIYSYLKAADFFMKKFGLKKIIFKTPKINLGANRLKEKMGIPCLGDTIFDAPILIAPLASNLYELDLALLSELKAKYGIRD